MATIFARHYAPSFWDPEALSGPCPHLTLREWEVGVILCSLPLAVKRALVSWLIAPTVSQRRKPDSFSCQRSPFAAGELRKPANTLLDLFHDEIKAIRQTLDMPFEALHGITRDMLLVAHGARLRQLAGALGEPCALKEIEAMLRLAGRAQPRPAAYLSERWGDRWAWFFSGGGAGG